MNTIPGVAAIHKIREHLWAVDEIDRTILYINEGLERVLLLDTGFGLIDLPALVASLCPGKPIIVVNTHAHGDHNSGNGQFDTVYVGRMDEPFSHDDMGVTEREIFADHFLRSAECLAGYDPALWQPRAARHVIPLQDGDMLDLGGVRLEVLETPGHTIGSICLADHTRGELFTGDMMLTWQVWGQLTNSSSLRTYGESIHRLRGLMPEIRYIYPAHGRSGEGRPVYQLNVEALEVYDQGIAQILARQLTGEPFTCFLHDGLCALFRIGGMVYDPERLGLAPEGSGVSMRQSK